ncbi:hypothetical protein EVAR_86297_1 [Eumeta japonica]|uniref:Uncharacterized protein n=1 Tax=Eumeta variegata TaxID=151549 RepID=A0A4C1X7C0_EUMVA|nr:hypothetical protein EVAR_86297_1 [Eumeta japonica]
MDFFNHPNAHRPIVLVQRGAADERRHRCDGDVPSETTTCTSRDVSRCGNYIKSDLVDTFVLNQCRYCVFYLIRDVRDADGVVYDCNEPTDFKRSNAETRARVSSKSNECEHCRYRERVGK